MDKIVELPVTRIPHVLRVKSLYRRSLKTANDWFWQREELREKSVRIRAAFEANAAVANPQEVENLCARAELLLAYYAHPQPIVYPTGHGGTKWERNMPFPEHMINRLTPYDDSS